MIESQIRALFAEIADSAQVSSQVDVRLASHRGRVRLRWRRACIAGTSGLAAAAVVVAALVVARPVLPGSGPAASGPAAPRQFSPLAPYLTFGWLPAGIRVVAGDTAVDDMALVAQRSKHARNFWSLDAYTAGQCHLAGSAGKLTCPGGSTEPITGRAPAVAGHRAFWAGPTGCLTCTKYPDYLVWQYARDGWAELTLPTVNDNPYHQLAPAAVAAAKRDAVKIANHVRYGAATPPLLFPVQLTGLPGTWRVGSVYYRSGHGLLLVSRFSLTTSTRHLSADGGLTFQKGLPAFTQIGPAPRHRNFCGEPGNSTINGYRVVLNSTSSGQGLCAANADGLALQFGEQGGHLPISAASLFGDHLRLLGTNPANWTTKPIG